MIYLQVLHCPFIGRRGISTVGVDSAVLLGFFATIPPSAASPFTVESPFEVVKKNNDGTFLGRPSDVPRIRIRH